MGHQADPLSIAGSRGAVRPDPADVQALILLLGRGDEVPIEPVVRFDPDVPLLLERGEFMDPAGKERVHLFDNFCHNNTMLIWLQGVIDAVCIGYARLPDGPKWYQHSWGRRNGRIVDTTSQGEEVVEYFGVALSRELSDEFARWVDYISSNPHLLVLGQLDAAIRCTTRPRPD